MERRRGRPRLGWIDSVKVALGNRGMSVEAARHDDGKEWRDLVHMYGNGIYAVTFAWFECHLDSPTTL